jgi:uncharacterized MAPEG superfamily protein
VYKLALAFAYFNAAFHKRSGQMTAANFALPITLLFLLTFLQGLIPSIARWNFSKFEDGSSPSPMDGLGPRDVTPVTTQFVGRGERAMANLIEAMAMFIPAFALALFSGPDQLTLWAVWLFLLARIAYVPSYIFALVGVRSFFWTISMLAIVMLLISAWSFT